MKQIAVFLLIASLTFFVVSCGQKGDKGRTKFVTIGTGGVTGVYYPTGSAISKMVNKKEDKYGLKATVESTAGSVYNINSVLSGELDFGVAQSDRQYLAYYGKSKEWTTPQTDLRSVFSIYSESITLIASENSDVKTIKDIKGKHINLGPAGSGNLASATDVLKAIGYDADKDIKAEYIKPVESPGLIQDERIDGFFYTIGHPNGNIKEATAGRIKVRLVEIAGPEIDKLLEQYSYYAKSVIPKEFYPTSTNENDVNTIGVKATLVTSAKVSDDVVYAITKEVFDNFEEFKNLHPAYKMITKESMLKGLSAPIHKGALKYYKEKGLDKLIDPKLIIE